MENLNLQRAKSLLNRNYSVKGKVTLAKQSFSKYQPILGEHLARLNLRELSPRLAWFPFECFHDIQQVGRGGFATVYSATVCADKPGAFLDRSRVALKTLDEQHLQELLISVHLSNFESGFAPLDVYGISQDDKSGRYLMVFQYAAGGNLEQQPQLSDWIDVLKRAYYLACRLWAMHNRGIVHHDLHPGNLVIVPDEPMDLKIIDFGLANVADPEGTHRIYGRPAYLPPETFYGQPYTEASDIHCLGTLLWQLVVGVPPRSTAKWMCDNRLDGLREDLIPCAPKGFNLLLMRCWNTEPSKRPSGQEIVQLLSNMLPNGIEPTAQPVPFSPMTLEFIAERHAMHRQELSDPDSFAFFTDRNSSRFMTPEELSRCGPRRLH